MNLSFRRVSSTFLLLCLCITLGCGIMALIDMSHAMTNNGLVCSDYNHYGEMKLELITVIIGVVGTAILLFILSKKQATHYNIYGEEKK